MSPATKEDLDRIEKALENMEQKIGNKWAVPLAVAIITGIIGIASVIVQVSLERASTQERLRLENQLQEKKDALKKHESFYDNAISLLSKIDTHFKEACYQSVFKKGDQLNGLCGDYWELIRKYRNQYEEDFISKIKDYNEFVSDSLFMFETDSVAPPQRQKYFLDSKQKREEVESALDEFYKEYIKPQQHA